MCDDPSRKKNWCISRVVLDNFFPLVSHTSLIRLDSFPTSFSEGFPFLSLKSN